MFYCPFVFHSCEFPSVLELRLLMSNIVQVTEKKKQIQGECGDNLNLFQKYLDVLGQTLDCFDLDDDLALCILRAAGI